MPLWGSAFTKPTAELMKRFNDSLPYDRRWYAEDIQGSQAYALAIEKLSDTVPDRSAEDARVVVAELERIYNHLADLAASSSGAGWHSIGAPNSRGRRTRPTSTR